MKEKRNLLIGSVLIAAFALWTFLIQWVDVQAVGQNGKFMYPCTNNCEWFCEEPYAGKPHVRICEGLAPKDACLLD